MKKIPLLVLTFTVAFIFTTSSAHAQMMMNGGNTPSVNPTDIQNQQQDEANGKKVFEQFQNNQITCQKLTNDNFEKIGEYAMSQTFGNNTAAHVAMNQRMQQMRGVTGEEQMHIQIGKSVTGCISSSTNSQNIVPGGGGFHMMGWNGYGMMNGNYGFNGGFSGLWIIAIIIHLIIVVDLILAGIWLWQQISKNRTK